MRRDIKTYISYSEIFGRMVEESPLEWLKEQVRDFNLTDVFRWLVLINNMLVAGAKDPAFERVQGRLIEDFIDDEILEGHLKTRFGSENKSRRPIFFRQQILTLLKLCILECKEGAGLVIPEGKSPLAYKLGRCCLMVTDLIFSPEDEKALNQGTSYDQRKILACQMAPASILNNPPDIRSSLVRSDIIYSETLNSGAFIDIVREEFKDRFNLSDEFLKATGLSLTNYLEIAFSVYALFDICFLEDILDNPRIPAIHKSKFVNGSRISQEQFERYLALESIKLSDLPCNMTEKEIGRLSVDFNVFQRWPLVEMENGGIICLDPSFLVEKLSSGLYHTIGNNMPSRGAREKANKIMGLLFHFYVDDVMWRMYPKACGLYFPFPHYTKSKKNQNEAVDGLVFASEGHLIMMEYKGSYLKQKARTSGDLVLLEEDLNKKFGDEHKNSGVFQLFYKIEKLFNRDPSKRDEVGPIKEYGRPITKITPVLVVQEPLFKFDFFNEMLERQFRSLLAGGQIMDIEIAPLQVIDIESLENIVTNIQAGDFTLEQFLNVRAARDNEMIGSFYLFNWEEYFDSFRKRVDEYFDSRFDSFIDRIRTNFFESEE